MEKNLNYLVVYAGIAAGIAGVAGISHCLNQKKFIKVSSVREEPEIIRGIEKVSVRASDVKEFVERRRQRVAEKRKRMSQGKVVLL